MVAVDLDQVDGHRGIEHRERNRFATHQAGSSDDFAE